MTPALTLRRAQTGEARRCPSLNVTNASVGAILSPRSLEYWPSSLVLTNVKTGAFDIDLPGAPGQKSETRSDWFKKWLLRQKEFTSQPYYHVKAVLTAAGDDSTAADVGYAGRDRELRESVKHCQILNAIYLVFSKVLIGYGYLMWLPLIWMAAIVALGTVVFKRSEEGMNEARLRFDAFFTALICSCRSFNFASDILISI